MRLAWMRGPTVVVVGVVVLGAGAWWGLVRDRSGSVGADDGGQRSAVVDASEVVDFLPGCTIDTCRVLARRSGFRFDGREATLLAVAVADCAGGVDLHLVTAEDALWSGRADALCVDPVRGIERDRTGNAFLSLAVGAHTFQMVVLRAAGDEVTDFGSLGGRWTGESAAARDLDGDGVYEVVVSVDDCEPSCASGRREDLVSRWNGREYVAA